MSRQRNRLWTIWYGMIERCYNKNLKSYKSYGERGICVCSEWLDKSNGYNNFKQWAINNGYEHNLTLDRINFNGNYEPSNCRWTTAIVQANNRRSNRIVNYKGTVDTLANVCRNNGLNYGLINNRIQKGISVERALSDDFQSENRKYITYNNETHTQSEWTKILGFSKNTISERLRHGWSIEKALTEPIRRKK